MFHESVTSFFKQLVEETTPEQFEQKERYRHAFKLLTHAYFVDCKGSVRARDMVGNWKGEWTYTTNDEPMEVDFNDFKVTSAKVEEKKVEHKDLKMMIDCFVATKDSVLDAAREARKEGYSKFHFQSWRNFEKCVFSTEICLMGILLLQKLLPAYRIQSAGWSFSIRNLTRATDWNDHEKKVYVRAGDLYREFLLRPGRMHYKRALADAKGNGFGSENGNKKNGNKKIKIEPQ